MVRSSLLAVLFAVALPMAGQAQDAGFKVDVAPGLSAAVTALKWLPGKPIVQIDYTITNSGSEPVDLHEAGLTGMSGLAGVNRIGLLDFEGKRVYEVGSADDCLCTVPKEDKLAAGASLSGWAWFMPPETLKGPVAVRFGVAKPIFDVPLQ